MRLKGINQRQAAGIRTLNTNLNIFHFCLVFAPERWKQLNLYVSERKSAYINIFDCLQHEW